ncbi:hypothetical protein SAMN05421747_103246 [Parapedobacter composti]|uniref:Uncharacterized protein n=1 Tax=Parapedobacter composti TaxID=623281 RepID=A0A1I1FY79_9SPHI|nr:hypothetical protein SAMN05421747_103246 [Parapedobacter composti]
MPGTGNAMITTANTRMKRRNTFRKTSLLILGLALIAHLSACGLFRNGCKCPRVHRHSVQHMHGHSYGLSDGDSAYIGHTARQ